MLMLKSGLGMKLAVGALGLVLGIGGITAGAHFRAQHTALAKRRVFAGTILSAQTNAKDTLVILHVETRSGLLLTVVITPQTHVVQHGAPFPSADLRAGDRILGQVSAYRAGRVFVSKVQVIFVPRTAQGP